MIKRQQPYKRQIYICINNRHGESPSCGHSGSEEIVKELKKVAKELNLKGKIRVAKSGCMDLCAFGPNMMIWPDGLWYMKVTKENIPEIVEAYLKLEEADKKKEDALPNPTGK
ncbi:MAG: (2Fe-2S) ferredoxin domain-containing protein [Deltaproteobacteria bacterium]|nr:(2Fe-2S) ferredoxin domain-containing protein [Deltaproteobacteria bacterium]